LFTLHSPLLLAQVGFEPTASLGLSKGGLPVAYRANRSRHKKGQASLNAWPATSCMLSEALREPATGVGQPGQIAFSKLGLRVHDLIRATIHDFDSAARFGGDRFDGRAIKKKGSFKNAFISFRTGELRTLLDPGGPGGDDHRLHDHLLPSF